MLKFIPGILILQAITILLVLIAPAGPAADWGWLRLAIPLVIAGCLTAFWFGSIAARQRRDEISRLKEHHAKERETIRVNAERAKTRLEKKTQRQAVQAARRSARQANIKIGLAGAGVAAVGGVLVLTQFFSLGVLMLTAAGSALGGYLLRVRQEKGKLAPGPSDEDHMRVIEVKPDDTKQPLLNRDTEKDA